MAENLFTLDQDLTDLEPQEKAAFLYGVATYFEAMMKIGEVEHTNDWDWMLGFWLVNGTYIGDEDLFAAERGDDSIGEIYSDTFKPTFEGDKFFNLVDKETYNNLEFEVELWGNDPHEASSQRIKVKDIARIYLGQR